MRWQDGTPYFTCEPKHGVYLKLESFLPVDGDGKPPDEWDSEEEDEKAIAEWNASPHGQGARFFGFSLWKRSFSWSWWVGGSRVFSCGAHYVGLGLRNEWVGCHFLRKLSPLSRKLSPARDHGSYRPLSLLLTADMLGMERHGIKIRDPALVSEGATVKACPKLACHSRSLLVGLLPVCISWPCEDTEVICGQVWDEVAGTMGSSYVSAYRPGDWQGVYAEAKTESQQWVRGLPSDLHAPLPLRHLPVPQRCPPPQVQQVQEMTNQIHAKVMEIADLRNELDLKKIQHKYKDVAELEDQVMKCKEEVAVLKHNERSLSRYHQALGDLRAAEDHRKPRSKPDSPALGPDGKFEQGSPALAPVSPALGASEPGSNFEGAKMLLPHREHGHDHRRTKFECVKVSPKWQAPERYQKVRGVRNV
jgi:hypothetical protein